MLLSLITVVALSGTQAALINTGSGHANLTNVTQPSDSPTDQPTPGESIGQYIWETVNSTEDTGIGQLADGPVTESSGSDSVTLTPAVINLDAADSALTARSFQSSTQADVSVTTGGGANGYTITLPHGICETSVVGNFEFPNGETTEGATLLQLYNSLVRTHHTQQTLHDFTLNKALAIESSLNATLQGAICPPSSGGDRELLQRYAPEDVDGYYTAVFLELTGFVSISLPGIYLSISSNITNFERASGIVATGALAGFTAAVINRLRENEVINPLEAFILNVGLAIADSFTGVSAALGACVTPANLARQVQDLLTGMVADVFFGSGVPVSGASDPNSLGDIEMQDLGGTCN